MARGALEPAQARMLQQAISNEAMRVGISESSKRSGGVWTSDSRRIGWAKNRAEASFRLHGLQEAIGTLGRFASGGHLRRQPRLELQSRSMDRQALLKGDIGGHAHVAPIGDIEGARTPRGVGHVVLIVVGVHLLRQQQVLDVRQSTSPVALLLGFGKRRQKQTGQDGKDGALATRYWPIAR
jgi:hypothetical protein